MISFVIQKFGTFENWNADSGKFDLETYTLYESFGIANAAVFEFETGKRLISVPVTIIEVY